MSHNDYEWNEGYSLAALSKGLASLPQGAHPDFIAGFQAACADITRDMEAGGDGYI